MVELKFPEPSRAKLVENFRAELETELLISMLINSKFLAHKLHLNFLILYLLASWLKSINQKLKDVCEVKY